MFSLPINYFWGTKFGWQLFDKQDLKKKDKNHLHLVGTLFAFCIQIIFPVKY